MALEKMDVVIIGAGPAGYVAAIRLAQLGRKVTVIEKDAVGGVCLNRGCIPSKALIHAGNLHEKMLHAGEIGLKVKGIEVDFPKLMNWKDQVVKKLTDGISGLLKANGCSVIKGEARFSGQKSIEVHLDTKEKSLVREIEFSDCVIATGSRPSAIPLLEVNHKDILDSTSALSLKEMPQSLLCIGGGYIGLELGTFYAKMGVTVTVCEALPSLLASIDSDLTRVVHKKLEKLGVNLMVSTRVKGIKRVKKGIEVTFSPLKGNDSTAIFEKVLVTTGRTPNTDSLALERAGLKTEAKGFLLVDARRQTSVPHIFAIGDVAGQPLLAHKGSKEGIVAAEAIAGLKTVYDVRAMPAVIFTDPEIATVGLTEKEARAQGFDCALGIFPFAANGRALSVGETDGLVKVVSDRKSGQLLGVHIVGPEASNLIAEATLAIEMGAHVEDLALTVHAHPTLPEALMEASEAALGHAIHIFQAKPKATIPERANV